MITKIFLLTLGLHFALILFIGCSEYKEVHPQEEAVQLMDRGSYSQAIVILEAELLNDPQNQKTRVLLAASYAGRAGLLMENYIYLAQNILEPKSLEKNKLGSNRGRGLQRVRELADHDEKRKVLEFIEFIYAAISDLDNLILSFEAIPIPQSQIGIEDLNTAILILDIDKPLTSGATLYRGLLRLSKLKVDLENEYNFDKIFDCKTDVSALQRQFNKLKNQLDDIFGDFVLGIKASKSQEEIKELHKKISKNISQVIDLIENLGDEQAELALLHIQRNILGICL